MIAADTLAFVDISLERQVLGQMLRCRGVFDQYLAAGLQPDDFYREVHRWVFAAIVAVEAAGVARRPRHGGPGIAAHGRARGGQRGVLLDAWWMPS
jgi:hypothetical protein